MKAFIEINAMPGKIDPILNRLRRMKHVKLVCAVTGHCDIIAAVEAEKLEEITGVLLDEIHKTDGVIKSETLLCIHGEE